jgi:antitoxin (DNA-binding transcriptional repressor) of toxin-antitoxin stability system
MNKPANPTELKKIVKISEFKTNCLSLTEEVARTGQGVVITKDGVPIAELVPHQPPQRSARGIWKDKITYVGDIMSPIDVEWDAMK